ncbi:MAG: hypothetical protein K8W52_09550 [Deltaproteobacteria bacterium]|nr:hypothetical protein [Deltaproteobacteria bacterium]
MSQAHQFTHVLLRRLVLEIPVGTFAKLPAEPHIRIAFLESAWTHAGRGRETALVTGALGARIIEPDRLPGQEAVLIAMPYPLRPTDGFGALATWTRGVPASARYFLLEKMMGSPHGVPRQSWSEWRGTGDAATHFMGSALPLPDIEQLVDVARALIAPPPPAKRRFGWLFGARS